MVLSGDSPADDLLHRAGPQNAAVLDDCGAVADFGQLGKDVRADEDGLSAVGQHAEQLAELDPGPRIQAGGRLVEDQHRRIVDDGPGQAHPLFHALGERSQEPIANAGEIGELLDGIDDRPPLGAPHIVGPGKKVEVFVHGHVAIGGQRIGHEAHKAAGLLRIVDQRDPVHVHVALGRIVEGGHDAHGGGLARAVGADKAEDVARGKLERDVVDRLDLAEVAFEIDNPNVHRHVPSRCHTRWPRCARVPRLPKAIRQRGICPDRRGNTPD